MRTINTLVNTNAFNQFLRFFSVLLPVLQMLCLCPVHRMTQPMVTRAYCSRPPITKHHWSPLHKENEKRRAFVDKVLRVDHAGGSLTFSPMNSLDEGELGAIRIYDGQLAVLKNTEYGPKIQVQRGAD